VTVLEIDSFLKPGKRRVFRLHLLSAKGRDPAVRIRSTTSSMPFINSGCQPVAIYGLNVPVQRSNLDDSPVF